MLRFPVEPMNATLGSLPGEADDDHWAYEIKWDGYRTLAFVDDGTLRLQSRRLLDVTAKYPEVAELPAAVNAARAVLDGEIVCFDATGRPSFEALQRHDTQAVYHVFDILSVDGNDTVSLPYEERRALLVEVVEPGSNWLVPAHRIGDGAALLAATAERGLEGVMAKRLGSTYTPGKRTKEWRKIKNRIRAEVVIGGYTAGSGNREGTFGALLVGRRGDGRSPGVRRWRRHRVQPGDVGSAPVEAARPALRHLPVRPAPAAGVPARRDVGAPRPRRRDRAHRVHQHRARPPIELRQVGLTPLNGRPPADLSGGLPGGRTAGCDPAEPRADPSGTRALSRGG